MAAEWIDWKARSDGVRIVHKFNGVEQRVGSQNMPVDGWCRETNTVYQMRGCFLHGHRYPLNDQGFNPVRQTSCAELNENTEKIARYIREQCHNLVEIWECQWQAKQENDPVLRDFLKTHRLPHRQKRTMTQWEMLKYIQDGSLFGLVECDLRIPPHLTHTFEEMPPIFKNVQITRDDIGEHMKQYSEREGLMKQSRKSLIGSMFGLLQWSLTMVSPSRSPAHLWIHTVWEG